MEQTAKKDTLRFFSRVINKSEKSRLLFQDAKSILTTDDERLRKMCSTLTKLNQKYKNHLDKLTNDSEFEYFIKQLKKIAWLSASLSGFTKYTDRNTTQYITEAQWTVITNLSRAIRFHKNDKDFLNTIKTNLNDLFTKDLYALETALVNIIAKQVNITRQPIVLPTLQILTCRYTDHSYLTVAVSYLNKLSNLDFNKRKEDRIVAFRVIEVVGEALKNLSDGCKAKIKELPTEELRFLRNRIQHPNDGSENTQELFKQLQNNHMNCLKNICNELINLKIKFENFLSDSPQVNNIENFTNTREYVEKLKASMLVPASITNADAILPDGIISSLLETLPSRQKQDAMIKLYNFFFGKLLLDENNYGNLLNYLGLADNQGLKEAYQKHVTAGFLSFDEKYAMLQAIPDFAKQAVVNRIKSFFEKSSPSFPDKKILEQYLTFIDFLHKDIWLTNYDLLKTFAENKKIILEHAKVLLINSKLKAKQGIVSGSAIASFMDEFFNDQMKIFKRLIININDMKVFDAFLAEKRDAILKWFKAAADKKPNHLATAEAALKDLQKDQNFVPQSLDYFQTMENLFALPGYAKQYLEEILKGQHQAIELSEFLKVLQKNEIDLSRYQVVKPFCEAYRKVKKLPSFRDSVEHLKNALLQFQQFAKAINLFRVVDDKLSKEQLQLEYYLETVARFAEDLLEQPEMATNEIDHVALSELLLLKEFRNGLAHRPYAIDRQRLSYFSNTTLLYMLGDLKRRLAALEADAMPLVVPPIASTINSAAELRSFVYSNRSKIIEILTSAGVANISLKILGQAVGCKLGPQKLITFEVEFIYSATVIDRLLLEEKLRQQLGIDVLILDGSNIDIVLEEELSAADYTEFANTSMDFSEYLLAEEHVRLYKIKPETHFKFANEKDSRIAKNSTEAATAIGADNFVPQEALPFSVPESDVVRDIYATAFIELNELNFADHPAQQKLSLYFSGDSKTCQLVDSFGKQALQIPFKIEQLAMPNCITSFVVAIENQASAMSQTSSQNMSNFFDLMTSDSKEEQVFLKSLFSLRNEIAAQKMMLQAIDAQVKRDVEYLNLENPNLNLPETLNKLLNVLSKPAKTDFLLKRFYQQFELLLQKSKKCEQHIASYLDNGNPRDPEVAKFYKALTPFMLKILMRQPPQLSAIIKLYQANLDAGANIHGLFEKCIYQVRLALQKYIDNTVKTEIENLAETLACSNNFHMAKAIVLAIDVSPEQFATLNKTN